MATATRGNFPPTLRPAIFKRPWIGAAVTMRNQLACTIKTYSAALLIVLLLAFRPTLADTLDGLTEAVLEVASSDSDPGEMLVVLRGTDGRFYLEEKDFAA